MSIELQIQSSVFGAIIARAAQARLLTHCFEPIAAHYVDHADVAATPVELIAADGAVRLRLAIDVFVVNRSDLLAAPNAVPAGATAPAGRVFLLLELLAHGPVVSLRYVDVDLGFDLGPVREALGETVAAAKDAVRDAFDSLAAVDLTKALEQMGPPVTSSRVDLTAGVIAIRFEPAGNALAHLPPGQDWGLFLGGVSVEQLARSRITSELQTVLPSIIVNAHWAPAGTTPHVNLDCAFEMELGAFSADADLTFGSDFALAPAPVRGLRAAVSWSFHLDFGALVPGFVEDMFEAELESTLENLMDPARVGGTPTGPRSFTIDSPLPEVRFGGARFQYSGAVASPAGMTIGGPVHLPLDPGRDTLTPSVDEFGLPTRLTFCSVLARSGSGAPSKIVSLREVTTSGGASLEGSGAFGGFEIVSPGSWIEKYIIPPTDSAQPQRLRIVVPSAEALAIKAPIRLIVRTARGVRLIVFGTPPRVALDENGNVTNALTDHIPNCAYLRSGPSDEHHINWGSIDRDQRELVTNPDRRPEANWATFIERDRGLAVQLVTFSGLEPGELLQFRSGDHTVDVTADHRGRALMPVLLPLTNDQGGATLTRVNRRSVAGHFHIRTALFQRQAMFPAGRQNRLESSGEGTAVLTTEFENHVDVRMIGALGALTFQKRERSCERKAHGGGVPAERIGKIVQREQPRATSLRPRLRRDPRSCACQPPGQATHLPGLTSLVGVPGFTDEPIALATMSDGSIVVLDLAEGSATRVAGTFTGPIGALDVSDDWALAVDADRASLFRVTRA